MTRFDYSKITDLPESDPRHPIHHQDWDYKKQGPPPWWSCRYDHEQGAFIYEGKVVNSERRVMGIITAMEKDG